MKKLKKEKILWNPSSRKSKISKLQLKKRVETEYKRKKKMKCKKKKKKKDSFVLL